MTTSLYEQRILDKSFDANIALWNSLITANSILVAVGSTLAALVPRTPILLWCCLLFLCATSLALITINFKVLRDLYDRIGQILSGTRQPRGDDAARANSQRRVLRVRERIAIGLLFGELSLIVVGLLWDR